MKNLSAIVGSWTPDQWDALVREYLPANFLTEAFWQGRPGPCPICRGGTDRFTYDNKRGRGDWVCRKCNDGRPKAGDGLELVRCVTGMSYLELMRELAGGKAESLPRLSPHQARRIKADDPAAKMRRILRQWGEGAQLSEGDHAMRYLAARVPGLRAPRPQNLRLAVQDYWHRSTDSKQMLKIGRYPTILAGFMLPDGRLATVHRTSLDPVLPAKATIISNGGEILPAKRNDVSALPLAGGAVRLMQPRGGEIGVAEGLENAYAAYMLFRIPAWNCLNRVLLRQFVVPDGLGIHTVHIFADFDTVDPRTGKSPGMADALALDKRLRSEGFKTVIHRPKVRGTDFCDQWRTEYRLRQIAQQAIAA